MKGLVLSGGTGTRLRPFTYTQSKQLLPIANKPILYYVLHGLIEAGIHDIGIVVGDNLAEIQAFVEDAEDLVKDQNITYIQQDKPRGLSHALKVAESFIGQERFVTILGDTFLEEPLNRFVKAASEAEGTYNCHVLLSRVSEPGRYGLAAVIGDIEDGYTWARVHHLAEKPSVPTSDLAIAGIYFFDSHIFGAIDAIQSSPRGEFELTDAIQLLIDQGYVVTAQLLQSYWADLGTVESILEANYQKLLQLTSAIDCSAIVTADTHLLGPVKIEAGARIENSVIRGPAIIGKDSIIANAYIGPFTSIDRNVRCESCEIEHSIILCGCKILHVCQRIDGSVIGRYSEISSARRKPGSRKFILGDHSKIVL